MLVSDPDSTNLSVAVEMTIMNKVFIFANFSYIQELYVCYKNSKSTVYYTCLNMDIYAKKVSMNVLNSIQIF